MDHLRDVIIEDSLGICDELDKQMQHLVDTYHCEWKDAIEDPEKLKRFRHFSNSESHDPTIKQVLERDQIRPANEEELAARYGSTTGRAATSNRIQTHLSKCQKNRHPHFGP